MFRKFAFAGAVLAASGAPLLAPHSASALTPPILGSPLVDPCQSPPSVAADGSGTCTDPNYLSSCPAEVPACQALVGPAFQQYYASAPAIDQVVLPKALPHQVDATHAGLQGTTYDAAHTKATAPANTVAGTGATFLHQPSPTIQPGDPTINSCAEYVYKKWLGYSWIDDYMRTPGGTLGQRAAYESYFFLSPFLRIDGQPIDANGTSITPLPRGATMPRNIFLAPGVMQFLTSADATQAAILTATKPMAGQPITIPNLNDLEMAYATFEGASYVADATLRDNEDRMNAFAQLLGSYGDTNMAIYHAEQAISCLGVNKITQNIYCPLWAAGGGDNYAATPFAKSTFGVSSDMRQAAVSYYLTSLTAPGGDQSGIPKAYRGVRPANPLASYQSALAQLQAAQADLSNQIQQAIVGEWNYNPQHGCLGGYPLGVAANLCDLPARYLEDRYSHLFQNEREAAYDRCIADTGDNFEMLSDKAKLKAFFDDPSLQTTDWHTSLSQFETFLSDYEQRDALNKQFHQGEEKFQKALLASSSDLPLLGAPSTDPNNPQKIGQSKQDSDERGGDWFGGGYSYGYDWSVTPHVGAMNTADPICGLGGEAGATFEAHAMVLKQKFSVVDTAFQVSSIPGKATLDKAHFSFLGQSYFNDDGKDLTGQTFNQPIDATPVSGAFSADIPVGPFMLGVGGGASLQVGVNLQAAIVAPPSPCNPNDQTWSLKASVTPQARADAFAYVAVDLVVVKAGVEGNVELLGLQAPLSVQAKLVTDPIPDMGLDLSVTSDASLALTELSGKVSLYAEVDYLIGSNRAELELFSWDGFRQNVPLWHAAKNYPLKSIDYRLFGNFDPADVDNIKLD